MEDSIKKSLDEKKILLQEIHHRVKNNMAVISGILSLQRDGIDDDYYTNLLKESENRIRSMAMVHEKLYETKDFSHIDFGQYIQDLASSLLRAYSIDSDRVRLDVDVINFSPGIDTAVPLGLLLNELLTNAMRHAFPNERKGVIYVGLHRRDKGLPELPEVSELPELPELIVRDDGIGLPAGLDVRNTETLGFQIIMGLAEKQLGAEVSIKSEGGTEVRIVFKEPDVNPSL